MADAYNTKALEIFKAVKRRYIQLSGTVTKLSNPVERNILVYKSNLPTELLGQTVSDILGNFTLSIPCGSNDFLRVVCVGNFGENSEIFDYVAGS